MRWFVFLPLALFTLLLVGCFVKPASDSREVEGMVVEIWVSNDHPQPGDRLKIRATVTNQGSTPFQVELKDQPVLDIRVGAIRWSQGKPLTPDVTRLQLNPGQAKTLEMEYSVDQNANGGGLLIQAIFIYSARIADYPITAGVTVPIGNYIK